MLFVGTAQGMRSLPRIASAQFDHRSSHGVDFPDAGAAPNCSTPSDEGYAAVGQEDGVFFYDADDRLDCYVCKGKKSFLSWYKGYLVLVMDDVRGLQRISVYDLVNKFSAFSMTLRAGEGSNVLPGKKDMFGAEIEQASANAGLLNIDGRVTHVVSQWGLLIFVTSAMKIYLLSEKGLEAKLDQLFRKHLYQTALKIVDTIAVNPTSRTFRIHKMYAEHLFSQGEYDKAVDQYIKTIGGTVVQPSDVIRRFLGAKHPRRIINLTRYLDALHKDADGGVTSAHTTLLIKCFTKHQDQDSIQEFLKTKFGGKFDAESTVRVLRTAGYVEEAAELAERYDLRDLYLRILLDDMQDCRRALEYISSLPFLDAELAVKTNGKYLMQMQPDSTTDLLTQMCTKPHATNVGSSEHETSYIHSKAEDFISIFVDHPLQLKRFLWLCVHAEDVTIVENAGAGPGPSSPAGTPERESGTSASGDPYGPAKASSPSRRRAPPTRSVMRIKSRSKLVWNTLIELCLREDVAHQDLQSRHKGGKGDSPSSTPPRAGGEPHGASLSPRGRAGSAVTNAKELVERETTALLEASDPHYDSDHAIVLVQQHRFTAGLLFLYEKRKMYHMLLQYYMDTGNNRQVLIACRRYGKRDKNLWAQVLAYFCHREDSAENQKMIKQILKYIEDENILTPTTVLQIASKNSNLPLSVIRGYIVSHVEAEERQAEKDQDDIDSLRAQIQKLRDENEKLRTHVKVFPNTKCDFTGHPLELPVIHFMSGFSYNLENVPDGPDGRRECPNTANETRRVLEMAHALDDKSGRHEDFFRELKFSASDGGDGFAKVAECFSHNIFQEAGPKNP